MLSENKREEKPEFLLLKVAYRISADTYCNTTNAPKALRLSICRKLQDLSDCIVDLIDEANSINLFDMYEERQATIAQIEQCLAKFKRRLEVAVRCRCLSLGDQAVLHEEIGEFDDRLQNLKKSDEKRYAAFLKSGERK